MALATAGRSVTQVTVTSAHRCPTCGVTSLAQGRASAPASALRHARAAWSSNMDPTTFRVERWSRGENPRIVFAGQFPGWTELAEVVREVARK